MNLFLAIALHVLSFAALVLATAVALYAVVLVGRRLLHAQAQLGSQLRLQTAQAARCEEIITRLSAVASECYEAEIQAIYESRAVVKPPTLESVTGSKLWEERL